MMLELRRDFSTARVEMNSFSGPRSEGSVGHGWMVITRFRTEGLRVGEFLYMAVQLVLPWLWVMAIFSGLFAAS